MEQYQSPAIETSRGDHRSDNREMDIPVTGADPTPSVWDWDNLFELASDDHFTIPFDDYSLSASLIEPPAQDPDSGTVSASDRIRKRDPRMTCSNFVAGIVPCACPEIDAQLEKLEEEEAMAPGKKRARTIRVGQGNCRCQVPGCEVDISELKGYHRRHRICLPCANSSAVLIDGETRRYCQQCGKFHLLSDFDEGKRSCRRKLERHNNRRRKKPIGSKPAVDKESRAAVQSDGIACDSEAGKDGVSLSGQIAEEPAFESEDAPVSAHCSDPVLQNIRNDSETVGGKDDSNVSNSTSFCDSKMAYSSMCPTGRISFKLYDWNPAEFPRRLRHQIFEWLANMPVELEGYIRPGCSILTVFISMPKNMWVKLSENPRTYMHDFVLRPGRMLYGRGFMTIYLNDMIFRTTKDGTSMLQIDAKMEAPRIHYVHPACFEAGKPMEFVACGSNLLQPKFRFLVSFAGKYLPNDCRVASSHVHSKEGSSSCDHRLYKIYVPQTEPDLFGPAFIEVENQSGLSNFIPVLIGNKEVCSEMMSIQKRFDASVFRDGSKFSATESLFEACEASTLRQRGYSELVSDIAWLLREPKLENFQETMTSSQLQRFNRLLSSLIQYESKVILKKTLQNIKIAVEKIGFNGTDDSDIRLLQKYMDCAGHILTNKLPKGEIPVFSSDFIERERIQHAQSSFKNDELSFVPNVSQVSEERTNGKLQTMTEPTISGRSETVPLLNKEIIMNVNLSKDYSRTSCSFATMRLRSRPAVFVIATAAICIGMCAVIFHPNRVGEFAVTIRRCLFDRM